MKKKQILSSTRFFGDRLYNGSPKLSDRCLSCLYVCLSVCNVGLFWTNSWMDQNETWHAITPRSCHIVLDVDPPPLPKGAEPPIFGPCLLWPNSWMDQDATLYRCRPRPRPHCASLGLSYLPQKNAHLQFSAHVCCSQMVGWIKMPLGTKVGNVVLPGDQAPRKRGTAPNFRPISTATKWSPISATTEHLLLYKEHKISL